MAKHKKTTELTRHATLRTKLTRIPDIGPITGIDYNTFFEPYELLSPEERIAFRKKHVQLPENKRTAAPKTQPVRTRHTKDIGPVTGIDYNTFFEPYELLSPEERLAFRKRREQLRDQKHDTIE